MLRLRNPKFTRNMETYRLRDEYFMIGIQNQMMSEIMQFKLSIWENKSGTRFSTEYNNYLNMVMPWMEREIKSEHQRLREEFQRFQEEKDAG